MIEDNKDQIGVQEYSVSQTSLEQIFQMFANQSIAEDRNAFVFKKVSDKLTLLNPGKETMPDQHEVQSRGLSEAGSRRGSFESGRDP